MSKIGVCLRVSFGSPRGGTGGVSPHRCQGHIPVVHDVAAYLPGHIFCAYVLFPSYCTCSTNPTKPGVSASPTGRWPNWSYYYCSVRRAAVYRTCSPWLKPGGKGTTHRSSLGVLIRIVHTRSLLYFFHAGYQGEKDGGSLHFRRDDFERSKTTSYDYSYSCFVALSFSYLLIMYRPRYAVFGLLLSHVAYYW